MTFDITYNSHVIELSRTRVRRSSTWLPLKTWHKNGKSEQKKFREDERKSNKTVENGCKEITKMVDGSGCGVAEANGCEGKKEVSDKVVEARNKTIGCWNWLRNEEWL